MNRDCINIVMLYENAMQQPTMTTDEYGNKRWRLNGKFHREDGPAIEWADGDKEWWLNGKYHREDGPAFEGVSGFKAWWLNDEKYEDAFEWAEALLKSKGNNEPSEDEINNKVQQVTSSSILD